MRRPPLHMENHCEAKTTIEGGSSANPSGPRPVYCDLKGRFRAALVDVSVDLHAPPH